MLVKQAVGELAVLPRKSNWEQDCLGVWLPTF